MYHADQSMQDVVIDAVDQDGKNKATLDPNLGIVFYLAHNSREFTTEATYWEN